MRLLAVHPGAELYGSDRSFGQAVGALDAAGHQVTVALPHAGPILSLPAFDRVLARCDAIWVPRRGMMTLRFLRQGMRRVVAAWRAMAAQDAAYIDTIVAMDYLIASVAAPRPCAVHVREIPTGMEMAVFRWLLIASRAELVFNSVATRDAFRLPRWRLRHARVVHNGVALPPVAARAGYDGVRPLRVLMIGRLNGWKGQEVLVAALAGMPAEERARIAVRIVGGVFGDNDHFRASVAAAVAAAGLQGVVAMEPFTDTPDAAYDWADVVVVPSVKPEPFGRVAIEAMAHGCAVVASAHGGLTEIVADGATGRLVPPGDAGALAAALLDYATLPGAVARHGAAGRARFRTLFTAELADRGIVGVVGEMRAA